MALLWEGTGFSESDARAGSLRHTQEQPGILGPHPPAHRVQSLWILKVFSGLIDCDKDISPPPQVPPRPKQVNTCGGRGTWGVMLGQEGGLVPVGLWDRPGRGAAPFLGSQLPQPTPHPPPAARFHLELQLIKVSGLLVDPDPHLLHF